jgi:twitching motility protein PilU
MLGPLIKTMHDKRATDLYLTINAPPTVSCEGKLYALDLPAFKAAEVDKIARDLMSPEQSANFQNHPELNLGISDDSYGRFRVNVYRQRGETAMVIRRIEANIPSRESLKLPAVLDDLILTKRGLLLFVGATASGKSTSMASLIDHRNKLMDGHIITIEDPIEFIHPHQKSLVSQREVGIDTLSYAEALENALRQAPSLLQIGEIRTQETMEHAIAFSETGHLCLSTLHANNANQAIDRIINFFPENKRQQILLDLSFNLKGIVSQRLVPGIDGNRVAATEILLGSPLVSDYLQKGKISELKSAIEKSVNQGMQTFDHDLARLYREGSITRDVALQHADSHNNLRLQLDQLDGKGSEDNSDSTLSLKKD